MGLLLGAPLLAEAGHCSTAQSGVSASAHPRGTAGVLLAGPLARHEKLLASRPRLRASCIRIEGSKLHRFCRWALQRPAADDAAGRELKARGMTRQKGGGRTGVLGAGQPAAEPQAHCAEGSCHATVHGLGGAPTFTNRRLYLMRCAARPFGFFFLSAFATLGVCPLTLPARAKDPCTLPAAASIAGVQRVQRRLAGQAQAGACGGGWRRTHGCWLVDCRRKSLASRRV